MRCASPDCIGEAQEWSSLQAGGAQGEGPDEEIVPAGGAGAAVLGSRAALGHRASAPSGAAREVSARRQVSVWPAVVALAALIVWVLYQSFLLAGESGLLSRSRLRVVAAEVGLHASPSTDSPDVAVLPAGTRVDLVSVGPRWAKIVTGSGRVGYIPRDRLEAAKPQQSTRPRSAAPDKAQRSFASP
jgi:hypothetical protein